MGRETEAGEEEGRFPLERMQGEKLLIHKSQSQGQSEDIRTTEAAL